MLRLRYLYTIFLTIFFPVIIARLYWKGRRLADYRQRIAERFMLGHHSGVVDIWVHAVSMGEVIAAKPMVLGLLDKGWKVIITTMTPTGSHQVRKIFSDKVAHQYLPYDHPWIVRRFYKKIQPKVAIIMETELWPNYILQAPQFNIPMLIVNARISEKAFPQYKMAKFFFKPLLNQLNAILVQSSDDAIRFQQLGVESSRIQIFGNMKFDALVCSSDNTSLVAQKIKSQLGDDRTVLLLASTHSPEEQMVLEQWPRLLKAIPNAVLWIAPRHPERFDEIVSLVHKSDFRGGRRSQYSVINSQVQVVVIDSIGELGQFFRCCDYAFVGGSLVPMIGGHNVLEPILLDIPTFCGPYMQNSKQICEVLCQNSALQQVNTTQLVDAMIAMHEKPLLREQQIANARNTVQRNQGSVKQYLDFINNLIS